MNILIVNHYAGSPHYGMEFRPYYLAREWIRLGHNVRIIAGSYSHIRAVQPSLHGRPRVVDVIDGIEYMWLRTPIYRGNGLSRVLSMVSFIFTLWRNARSIASSFQPDVVIASSTYPMDIWPAARISRCLGAQLVYEVHDLWPLSPMELGGMAWWHPFIIWVQMAEDYAYKQADHVVSMLPGTLDYMVSRGLDPAKWVYVPNGVDLDEWCAPFRLPDDVRTALHEVTSRGQLVLGYAGTHGLANALDALLDTAYLLQGHLQIVLVGTGPERERLIRRVESERLCNVTMLGAVPKEAMPALLSAFDLAFIGWHDNPLYRFGISPNKLLDYMMSSTPIIHAVNAGNDLVSEVGCGISVPPNNPYAIAQAAQSLCAITPGQRCRMGQKGLDYVRAERSYAVLARQFLDALKPHA